MSRYSIEPAGESVVCQGRERTVWRVIRRRWFHKPDWAMIVVADTQPYARNAPVMWYFPTRDHNHRFTRITDERLCKRLLVLAENWSLSDPWLPLPELAEARLSDRIRAKGES